MSTGSRHRGGAIRRPRPYIACDWSQEGVLCHHKVCQSRCDATCRVCSGLGARASG